jgi:hypothetical protein
MHLSDCRKSAAALAARGQKARLMLTVTGARFYRLIETPFTILRARRFPTNFPSTERFDGKVTAAQ